MAGVNVKREGIGQPRPAAAFRFHEKHPHRVGLFLAGLRPLVLIGGILPPVVVAWGSRQAEALTRRREGLPKAL